MDITEFLAARLDEDEAYARHAFGDHNNAQPDWYEIRSGAVNLAENEDELVTFDSGVSRHIVRQDPARTLREVKAKRAILREHPFEPYADEPAEGFCGECQRGGTAGVWPCPTVRHTAAVYADQPDYQQQWTPHQ